MSSIFNTSARRLNLMVCIMVVCFLLPTSLLAQASANVLLLNSYHSGYRWSDEIIHGISDALNQGEEEIQLFVEYMDSKRIQNQATSMRLAELIQEKYHHTPLDAVVVADDNAFSFFKKHRDNLFPEVPAIFCGANDLQASSLIGIDKITGVNEAADITATLDTALMLLPRTTNVIVVTDQTATGKNVSREIRRQVSSFSGRVSFDFWDDLSMELLLSRLETLRQGSIVLYAFFFRDSDGNFFEYDTSARLIASASPVPVFGLWEFSLGYGIVGGMLVSGYGHGHAAGEMALRLIRGVPVESIPLLMKSPNRFAFDYRMLAKFGLEDSDLPEGSLVINETVSLYEKHKGVIWSFLLAFLSLSVLTIFLLISIRKQRVVEQNLRRSRRFITGITDNAPGAVFQLSVMDDGKYQLTFASEKIWDIFGLDQLRDELFDRFVDQVHDDDRRSFWLSLNEAVSRQIPWTFEGRYLRKAGGTIWFTAQAAPRVEEGRTVLDGVLIDSTDSKNTKDKLLQSEKRLADIIDFLPDPTFVIDPAGRLLTWNRAMEELTGIAAKDILGKGEYEYALPFYGERRPVMIDLVGSWNDEIAQKYREVLRVGDHLISESIEPNELLGGRYFRNVAGPLYDQHGNVAGAIETLHDITKRRKAEQDAEKLYNETQANLAFIKALMSAIPIPVYFKDTSCKFMDCNQAYLDMQGVQAIKGKTVYDLYPEERATFYHEKDLELLKEQNLQKFETVVIDRDQQRREVIFAKSVFHDHTGEVAGIVGAFMDISDLKGAERAKEQLEVQLRQSQKMEALGTLAGGVAHDFNNILSAVLGYSELGLREKNSGAEHQMAKFRSIHRAGTRAKELVDQILAFSRMQEQVQAPVQMVPLVKEVLKLLKSSLPSDIEIRDELGNVDNVLGDATQIHQVIMNLCTNAYHAMQKGGGVLRVLLEHIEIEGEDISGDLDIVPGKYVHLTVSDTGCGINPSILAKIFDPYFTTKKKDKGTGLGLAVVHGIVKRHKGMITVHSRVAKGTEFHVYLPACGIETDEGVVRDSDLLMGSEHILLVDDEKDLIQVGTEMLNYLGYRVSSMEGSEAGLAAFKANPLDYDLVISDFDMPGMTGARLAHEMLAIRPDLPIIIYTGYTERFDDSRARAMGVGKVLMKPLSLAALGMTVRELLDHKASGEHGSKG